MLSSAIGKVCDCANQMMSLVIPITMAVVRTADYI